MWCDFWRGTEFDSTTGPLQPVLQIMAEEKKKVEENDVDSDNNAKNVEYESNGNSGDVFFKLGPIGHGTLLTQNSKVEYDGYHYHFQYRKLTECYETRAVQKYDDYTDKDYEANSEWTRKTMLQRTIDCTVTSGNRVYLKAAYYHHMAHIEFGLFRSSEPKEMQCKYIIN